LLNEVKNPIPNERKEEGRRKAVKKEGNRNE
jgi:hypothetical protein